MDPPGLTHFSHSGFDPQSLKSCLFYLSKVVIQMPHML